MGPLFGVIMANYYLFRRGQLDVAAPYREDGEFRYVGGWNVKALVAAGVAAIFSQHPARPMGPPGTPWAPTAGLSESAWRPACTC
jgi:cytosine/uracil/thiamine/allantoin permease